MGLDKISQTEPLQTFFWLEKKNFAMENPFQNSRIRYKSGVLVCTKVIFRKDLRPPYIGQNPDLRGLTPGLARAGPWSLAESWSCNRFRLLTNLNNLLLKILKNTLSQIYELTKIA